MIYLVVRKIECRNSIIGLRKFKDPEEDEEEVDADIISLATRATLKNEQFNFLFNIGNIVE